MRESTRQPGVRGTRASPLYDGTAPVDPEELRTTIWILAALRLELPRARGFLAEMEKRAAGNEAPVRAA